MEGLKIQCPNCKRTDFVTTERYNPDVTPNGSMVKCLLPYHIDWLTSSTTLASEITCPECCAQLAPSGRLVVIEPPAVNDEEDVAREILQGGPKVVVSDEVPPGKILVIDKATEFLKAETISGDEIKMPLEFPCPICGKPFPDERKMKGHLGGAHRGKQ